MQIESKINMQKLDIYIFANNSSRYAFISSYQGIMYRQQNIAKFAYEFAGNFSFSHLSLAPHFLHNIYIFASFLCKG